MTWAARLRGCLLAIVLTVPAACTTIGASVPAPDAGDPQAAWARVLARYVDREGRVDFTGLATDRGDLGIFIAYIALTPPDAFAERRSKLAYLINSYNALSMASVLDLGIPGRLDLPDRIQFFVLRVHFALNCMAASCPRLPQHSFTTDGLDRELDAAARDFFAEPRNLAVDPTRRELSLSEILSFYTEDFLAKAPSLLAYVNRWRGDKVPADFRVTFFPYDWTINRQGRASS